MNTAVLVGRVGRDAEIKYFESGKVKANFSIAVNRWDPKTKSEVADWFNIDVWDKLAEFAGEYVKKGEILYTIYSNNEDATKIAQRYCDEAFSINETRPSHNNLIYKIISTKDEDDNV